MRWRICGELGNQKASNQVHSCTNNGHKNRCSNLESKLNNPDQVKRKQEIWSAMNKTYSIKPSLKNDQPENKID